MNTLLEIRDRIRNFVSEYESWCIRGLNFLMLLLAMLFLNANLGYAAVIDKWWVAIVVAVIGAFFPTGGGVFILIVITEVHLFALSMEIAIAGLVFFMAAYLLCAYFKAKDTYNIAVVPTFYCMHMPFMGSMLSGLLQGTNELASVIGGSLVSYFLYVVKNNASAVLDETSKVTAISLVTNQIFKSKMFYFYMVAMILMFVIVHFIKQADIKYPWLLGIGAGATVEFLIMLIGLFVCGESSKILGLIIGNIIVVVVGLILNLFLFNLDYSRIEKLQFQDDDYYYYVTAVPKIRIASADKKIKRI